MTSTLTEGLADAARSAYMAEQAETHVRQERERRDLDERLLTSAHDRLVALIGQADAAMVDLDAIDDPAPSERRRRAIVAHNVAGLTLTYREVADAGYGAWYADRTCVDCGTVQTGPPVSRLADLGHALGLGGAMDPHHCVDPEASRPPKPASGVAAFPVDTADELATFAEWVAEWDDVQIVPLNGEIIAVGHRRNGF